MNLLRLIISWLYGLGVWVRNLLYDEHVIYTHHPQIPTICVGNLAVGGTGKTPHVEYVVSLLLRHGYRVAVLSRGYKRRTSGFVLAGPYSTADSIGDEPRQVALNFPDAIVAVCEDRYRGIRRLCKMYPDLDVIILDDAFQHRKVRCGYNVLLTPSDRLYVNDHMLPYGRLREQPSGALRADMIVVSKCPPRMTPIERRIISTNLHVAAFQECVFSSIRYDAPVPVFPTEQVSDTIAAPRTFFLLTGIAQPQYMRDSLGSAIVAERNYPDHYRYEERDIADIMEAFHASGADCILTTEKDAMRLCDSGLIAEADRPLFYYQPIAVTFEADSIFDSRILRYVSEHRRGKRKTEQQN